MQIIISSNTNFSLSKRVEILTHIVYGELDTEKIGFISKFISASNPKENIDEAKELYYETLKVGISKEDYVVGFVSFEQQPSFNIEKLIKFLCKVFPNFKFEVDNTSELQRIHCLAYKSGLTFLEGNVDARISLDGELSIDEWIYLIEFKKHFKFAYMYDTITDWCQAHEQLEFCIYPNDSFDYDKHYALVVE